MKQKVQNPAEEIDVIYPEFEFGVVRRVVGNLGLSNSNVTIYAKEYWYIGKDEQNLEIPDDHLLYTKNRQLLEQGKTLATTQIDTLGDFSLEWHDSPIGHERPWLTDIYLTDDTYRLTMNLPPLEHFPKVVAYRILTLCWFDDIIEYEGDRPHKRFPIPMPTIIFYNKEEEKNVGQLYPMGKSLTN